MVDRHKALQRLKNDRNVMLEQLRIESLGSKHIIGSHNKNRLIKALAAGRRLDLVDRTLLSQSVHKDHFNRLNKRFQVRWEKLRLKALNDWRRTRHLTKDKKPTDAEVSANHLRFLTVIDCVCAPFDHK